MSQPSETDMEHDVEQDLEQSETETEQNETTMENHVEQDLGTDKTLLNKAVSMRQAGKTYREIEAMTKIPKATLCRHLKNVVPKTQTISPQREFQTENDLDSEGEVNYPSMSSMASPSKPHMPDASPHYGAGIIPLNEEDRNALRKLYPKNPHLVDSIFEIAETRENQRRQFNNNNNGHGNNGHEEPLSQREMLGYLQTQDLIDTIKMKRNNNSGDSETIKDLIRELRQNQQNKNNPLEEAKLVLELVARLREDASPRGQQTDPNQPIQLILAGSKIRAEVEQNVANQYQHVRESNIIDLKRDELAQNERLDNRKLDHQEKVWNYEQEHKNDGLKTIVDTTKEILEGPVGKFVESLGAGVADKIRGAPKAGMAQVQCPACKAIFAANPKASIIGCPQCGAKLQKQESPQPEQPQEPQAETPKPEPQQEPKIAEPENLEEPSPRWTPHDRKAWKNRQSEVIQKT